MPLGPTMPYLQVQTESQDRMTGTEGELCFLVVLHLPRCMYTWYTLRNLRKTSATALSTIGLSSFLAHLSPKLCLSSAVFLHVCLAIFSCNFPVQCVFEELFDSNPSLVIFFLSTHLIFPFNGAISILTILFQILCQSSPPKFQILILLFALVLTNLFWDGSGTLKKPHILREQPWEHSGFEGTFTLNLNVAFFHKVLNETVSILTAYASTHAQSTHADTNSVALF